MNKYELLKSKLEMGEEASMKCFGNSMTPILSNPSTCHYRQEPYYQVGDIVFCKVKGRYIDAHLITSINGTKFLISNNHGHHNGWTSTIYGRVFAAIGKDGILKHLKGHEPRET
jgi:hypothetical protein